MRTTIFFIVGALGVIGCGKKQEAAPAATGSAATGSGSAAATGSGATDVVTTGSGSGSAVVASPPPTAKTCADGDAAACVAEARAIAPTGAYRAKMSKEDADAKEKATTALASKACELGNGEGCALVAQYGGFNDSGKMLEKACELGYLASCGSVGRGLADGGKKADQARAAELLEKACDANVMDWMALTAHHGGFCRELQKLYAVTKDKAKEAKAHERACAQGDKLGCACKTTEDCGATPGDQSGDYFCEDGVCDMSGG